MSKMIQIRNVPDDLHRTLKARAARQGMTLSDMLLREIAAVAEKPTLAEWVEQVRSDPPIDLGGMTPAELVRANRPDP
ncbi:MAG: hypothetical protein U0R24_08065 [Solirubrobacterales bacterium]